MKNKEELRKIYKTKRMQLCKDGLIDTISSSIVGKIKQSSCFKNAKSVMLFYPKFGEINLLSLINDRNKDFYLPRCEGANIEVCPYKISDELKLSKHNVYEPMTPSLSNLGILDIVFTPALAADESGYRLGYGGGYYDRFLSDKNIKAEKIIVIHKNFICKQLPIQDCDVKCDFVLTD